MGNSERRKEGFIGGRKERERETDRQSDRNTENRGEMNWRLRQTQRQRQRKKNNGSVIVNIEMDRKTAMFFLF